jgi:precorrin-3B C17-methyltransferase
LPSENKLSIVGIGPGDPGLRTLRAEETIRAADFVVGYRPYLDLVSDLLLGKQVFSSGMGREVDRVKAALDFLEKGDVALVSSGDPNVYGMAGLGLEMAGETEGSVEIVPGVTSFTAAACRAGLVFRGSVAVISLSDLLTPWTSIEGRLRAAAELDLPVALYNPRSKRRDWQLLRALEILGPNRDALVAKNVSRPGEELIWTRSGELQEDLDLREKIDMNSLLILCGRGACRGPVTSRAKINVVGIGPGGTGELTREAERLLRSSARIFAAGRYLQTAKGISPAELVSHQGPFPERMRARFREASETALQDKTASILTGGDPSLFSSAWRVLEMSGEEQPVHMCPGVSAFGALAASAGAPLVNDFVLLNEARATDLGHLAKAGFGAVIYNARGHEVRPLLDEIDPLRPCALGRDVSRASEEVMVMKAGDLAEANPSGYRYTLLVSSAGSFLQDRRIIVRRGYENKYSY